MQDKSEDSVRRLQKINRYLMIGAVILAITIVLLAIVDFG
jgi:hypothetical protein